MRRTVTLSEYVKRRNGVPLGAQGSMKNMLERSLCARSFSLFWRYWNPIWGYYLSRNVNKPLSRLLPRWISLILTFAISGGLHDLAVSLIKWQPTFFFTQWFFLMAVIVLVSMKFNISYSHYHQIIRIIINLFYIVVSLIVALAIPALI